MSDFRQLHHGGAELFALTCCPRALLSATVRAVCVGGAGAAAARRAGEVRVGTSAAPTRDLRRMRQSPVTPRSRMPTMRKLVKWAMECQYAEELGRRLKQRY